MFEPQFTRRGFLPEEDPLIEFPRDSNLSVLDRLGRDLPSLLQDKSFRALGARLHASRRLPAGAVPLPELRLYYVRLGFLASAYVNQVGQEPATLLPRNIALPLCDVCARLDRPPILSYDGYALYNWKRFDPAGPIALGNIDTIQNFVHLYDEHWFILVHVEIEALAAGCSRRSTGPRRRWTPAIRGSERRGGRRSPGRSGLRSRRSAASPRRWTLLSITRRSGPTSASSRASSTRASTRRRLNFRGETGAQSSVIPTVVAFLKVPHKPSMLTDHLADMRRFMPREHRALIEQVERLPDPRGQVDKGTYNEALEALASFRETHLEFARRYIAAHVRDPRGTGGTPYLEWLEPVDR